MEFQAPVFDASRHIYKIRLNLSTAPLLHSAAQYYDLSSNDLSDIETPDTTSVEFQTVVKTFVAALLQKDAQAKWFASRLRESSILRRLEHIWDEPLVRPSYAWFVANWSPAMLEISREGFSLHWTCQRYEEAQPQISSRFLPPVSGPPSPAPERADGLPTVRQITVHANPHESDMEQVYDIPFTNENTALDLEEQLEDQRKIQEARLRLALARIKAERLTKAYQRKYGEDFSDEEFDSDISGEEGSSQD